MPAKAIIREHWSRVGFIFAAVGSAVGLGNIWRFPYMVGSNGGGAFLIPYIIGVVLFGIPMMILELDAGRKFKGSVITTLKKVSKRWWPTGLLNIAISLAIDSYYLVIAGWTLAYVFFSLFGYMEFSAFTASFLPLLAFFVTLALSAWVVSIGVKKGIERATTTTMPIFFFILIALTLYSLTLPGMSKGIKFFLTPDFTYLFSFNTWIMGFSQAFFSMSVGYGILLTYGSYLGKKTDIGKSAVTISLADTVIALMSGLLIFPIVFTYGLNPTAGAELSFMSLPIVFSTMPFGIIIGFFFFLLLFVAALTSGISILETGTSVLIDEKKWSRKKSILVASSIVGVLGIPSALTYTSFGTKLFGLPFLDFIDMASGFVLLVAASFLCIVLVWNYEPETIHVMKGILRKLKLNRMVMILLKFVIPTVLLVSLIAQFIFP